MDLRAYHFALACWLICLAFVQAEINNKSPMNISPGSVSKKISKGISTDILDEGRIVGGQNAVLGQFPYMVYVESRETTVNGTSLGTCGGSLISREWVLSAAHCIKNGSTYVLYMGLLAKPCDGDCIQTVPIKIIMHEEYNIPSKLNNDIVLFQLSPGVVTLSANVALIQLPAISESCLTYYGYNCTVSGWGAVSSDSAIDAAAPTLLRFVDVRVLPNDDCIAAWGASGVNEKHVCASTDRNKDSCQGDSGGPLVIQKNGTYTQIGVVSYGNKCADNIPGVYGRVSSYLDWISKKTGIVMRS